MEGLDELAALIAGLEPDIVGEDIDLDDVEVRISANLALMHKKI
jgi:hypothetical protein